MRIVSLGFTWMFVAGRRPTATGRIEMQVKQWKLGLKKKSLVLLLSNRWRWPWSTVMGGCDIQTYLQGVDKKMNTLTLNTISIGQWGVEMHFNLLLIFVPYVKNVSKHTFKGCLLCLLNAGLNRFLIRRFSVCSLFIFPILFGLTLLLSASVKDGKINMV